MSDAAQFHADVADGPEDVCALWARAADGVRLRLAFWPGGARGTVLLFPGRTEYVEKYGRTARDLRSVDLSTICLDWRGQGLADRPLDEPRAGHVVEFADYQLDVEVLVRVARAEGLPEPYFLLAHSMGGCIGLRALYEHLPVEAACFTAPMWGIQMQSALRPVAWGLSTLARYTGQGHRFVPGTGPTTYVAEAPFEGNLLTSDPEMYDYLYRQVTGYPDLALGGPSLHWLFEAMIETGNLMNRPAPDVPCVTYLGSNEMIVPIEPIRDRMCDWKGGRLEWIDGGGHEVLMETPEIRSRILAGMATLFLKEPASA